MTETKLRTALGEKILTHWREHCPQMVRDLEQQNRLEQSLFETQTRTGDLLYELVSVKRMDYQAAWELAREEWALPQGEKERGNETGDLPPKAGPSVPKSTPGNSGSTTSNPKRSRGRRRGTSG